MRPSALLAVLLLACACGSGAGPLLETAQLEELQHNPTHARELYREIVRRYPDTPEAAKARERLTALDTAQ